MFKLFSGSASLLKVAAAAILLLSSATARAAEDRIIWYSIGDGLTNTANITQACNDAVTLKYNAICFLARYRANAYYQRNRNFATYANPEPEMSAGDPLQHAIDQAHERGLRVYIAFSCFLVTDGSNTYPAYVPAGSVTHMYVGSSSTTYAPSAGFPRAMTTADDSEGLWADVGRADVRTYTTNVLMDIVQNYDIDGVVFDRVRYRGDDFPKSAGSYGYNPTALSEMVGLGEIPNTTPAPGAAAFIAARQNAVTRFITNASAQIYALKPWVITGSAPITYSGTLNDTYNSVFQHFPSWNNAVNSGHVSGFGNLDFIAPQYYRTDPALNASTMDLTNAAIDEVNRIKHQSTFSTASSIATELAQNICDGRQKGLVGFGTFAYNGTKAAGYISGANATNTAPCGTNIIGTATTGADYNQKIGWDTLPPNPVTGASGTGGFGNVTLNWTPPAAAADGDAAVRYLIYRSSTSPVKEYYVNQLAFTSTITGNSYTDNSAPTGTQYYKIVAVDDYNNKTAVQVGPVTVQGIEIYVEARVSAGAGGGLSSGYTETPVNGLADTTSKSSASGLVGAGSRFTGIVGRSGSFKPNITTAGNYNVYVTLDDAASGPNNSSTASYSVTNSGATRTGNVVLDPATAGLANAWLLLESDVPMPLGQTNGITFTGTTIATGKRFVMDAVRFEFTGAGSAGVMDWSMY